MIWLIFHLFICCLLKYPSKKRSKVPILVRACACWKVGPITLEGVRCGHTYPIQQNMWKFPMFSICYFYFHNYYYYYKHALEQQIYIYMLYPNIYMGNHMNQKQGAANNNNNHNTNVNMIEIYRYFSMLLIESSKTRTLICVPNRK